MGAQAASETSCLI